MMNAPKRSPKTIGASDIAVLFGESSYDGLFNLWLRLIGKISWQPASENALWGQEIESSILANYCRRFRDERPFEKYGETFVHPDNEFYCATPDAVDLNPPFIIDAKDYLKPNFILQAHWQMFVFNAATGNQVDHAIFHCCDRGGQPEPVLYEWNDNLHETILERVEKLFKDYVIPQRMPTPDDAVAFRHDADNGALAKLYPVTDKKDKTKIPATDEITEYLGYLTEIKKNIAESEEAKRYFQNLVCDFIGKNEAYGVENPDGTGMIWYGVGGKLKYKQAIEHLIATGKISHKEWLELEKSSQFRGEGMRIARLIEAKE